jgi:hypothetical protein
MNEFKVRYVKAGVPTYIDFMTAENKTFLVTDKNDTIITDAFKVDPSNRLKFLEYVQKADITWDLKASWSGNPMDLLVRESIYRFHVLESLDDTLYQDTIITPGITTPGGTFSDINGNIITIPGVTTSDITYSTYKSFADMYSAALAESVFYSHLGLPQYYVGHADYNGNLFN